LVLDFKAALHAIEKAQLQIEKRERERHGNIRKQENSQGNNTLKTYHLVKASLNTCKLIIHNNRTRSNTILRLHMAWLCNDKDMLLLLLI